MNSYRVRQKDEIAVASISKIYIDLRLPLVRFAGGSTPLGPA